MHFSRLFTLALTACSAVFASPLGKRALSSSDQSVLELALFLEHLEYAFYSGAYSKFTSQEFDAAGFLGGFHDNVGLIATHEAIHAATITQILVANGATPIPNCTYSFPYTDVTSFANLANMITT
jgi:hypothetical protein